MGPPLKEFYVVGWMRENNDRRCRERFAMKGIHIKAVDGRGAAFTYAKLNNIPRHLWDDGGSSPAIVIRVEGSKKNAKQGKRNHFDGGGNRGTRKTV